MSDLVTRLRDVDEPNALIVRRQAADRIERYEAALREITRTPYRDWHLNVRIAREALRG